MHMPRTLLVECIRGYPTVALATPTLKGKKGALSPTTEKSAKMNVV